jgi:hypothetical protein
LESKVEKSLDGLGLWVFRPYVIRILDFRPNPKQFPRFFIPMVTDGATYYLGDAAKPPQPFGITTIILLFF